MDSESESEEVLPSSYWLRPVDSLIEDDNIYNNVMRSWFSRQVKGLKDRWKQSTGDVNKISNSRAKIQRIPKHMAERVDFKKYYEPQIISVGPFHLPKEVLLRGKMYKDIWASMYLDHAKNLKTRRLFNGISESNLTEFFDMFKIVFRNEDVRAKYVYDQDSDRGESYDPNTVTVRFAILASVLDGCTLLELLEKSDNSVDPEQELKISIDKLIRVHQDLLILDNQIPFQLLRILCEDESRLEKCLHNFLQVHGIQMAPKLPRKKPKNQQVKVPVEGDHGEDQEVKVIVEGDDEEGHEDPVHLLDYLRSALLMRDQRTFYKNINIKWRSLHLMKYRTGTIRDLKAMGIHVIRDDSNTNSFYPSFNQGILQLPQLTVDDSTAHIFLNLIAHEMCPDFLNHFEISSFIVFMSSLIDQPEDVKELRMAGVINHELASDKEVADLFNKLDSILVPETPHFAEIKNQILLHMENERRRITKRLTLSGKKKMLAWLGEAYNTFLRSPWTIIALLAATLGLVLTFIQTWFAVHPKAS